MWSKKRNQQPHTDWRNRKCRKQPHIQSVHHMNTACKKIDRFCLGSYRRSKRLSPCHQHTCTQQCRCCIDCWRGTGRLGIAWVGQEWAQESVEQEWGQGLGYFGNRTWWTSVLDQKGRWSRKKSRQWRTDHSSSTSRLCPHRRSICHNHIAYKSFDRNCLGSILEGIQCEKHRQSTCNHDRSLYTGCS